MLEVKLIDPVEFDGLRDEWNGLLRGSAADNLFLRWEWVHTWWDVFQPHWKLFIFTAREEGRLTGIAPFCIDRELPHGRRTLKMCMGEVSPDYMDIIAAPGQEADVARAFVNALARHAGEWDVIKLDNLRKESILLTDSAIFHNYVHSVRVSQSCPYLTIAGSFDDYYKSRSEARSFSLVRKLRILKTQHEVIHTTVNDQENLSKGLAGLFLLHEKRADSKNMRSNFLSADTERFHQKLCALLLPEGLLNFQLLYNGEKPISAFYGFNYNRKYYAYQTGFDPAWSKFSVGAVLWYVGIQKAFQEGIREFDFLKGTENYKSLWANGVRDEMLLTVYNNNLRGAIFRALHGLKTFLRALKARAKRA